MASENESSFCCAELVLELTNIKKSLLRQAEELEKRVFSESLSHSGLTCTSEENTDLPQVLSDIKMAVQKQAKVQELVLGAIEELEIQLRDFRLAFEELLMERDALQERVHAYLAINCRLKSRLEEQRCGSSSQVLRHQSEAVNFKAEMRQTFNGDVMALDIPRNGRIYEFNDIFPRTVIQDSDQELENFEKCLKCFLGHSRKDHVPGINVGNFHSADPRQVLDDRATAQPPRKSKSLTDCKISVFEDSESIGTYGKFIQQKSGCSILKVDASENFFENTSNLSSSATRERFQSSKEIVKSESRTSQLTALKNGLATVSKKLKFLKSQLIISSEKDVPGQKSKPLRSQRNLKRKAESLEETTSEDPNKAFENLKEILDDAKKLNAKLENLREEKQKNGERKWRGDNEKSEKSCPRREANESESPP